VMVDRQSGTFGYLRNWFMIMVDSRRDTQYFSYGFIVMYVNVLLVVWCCLEFFWHIIILYIDL